jgi:hypothetical protein
MPPVMPTVRSRPANQLILTASPFAATVRGTSSPSGGGRGHGLECPARCQAMIRLGSPSPERTRVVFGLTPA